MIIAVDGPAGAGKSTISKLIAKKLGITYIDTGAMYRAVTYLCLKQNTNLDSEDDVKALLENVKIDFKGKNIFANGEDVTDKIRTKQINENVSKVSAIEAVRENMVSCQRLMSREKSVVLDGRDIGTVVFPEADYKFFLVASVQVRAKRRYLEEIEKFSKADMDKIRESIEKRDYIDSHRLISPLKKAEDAIEIDTSNMSIEEVVQKITDIIGE